MDRRQRIALVAALASAVAGACGVRHERTVQQPAPAAVPTGLVLHERLRSGQEPTDPGRETVRYIGQSLLVSDDAVQREIVDVAARTYTRVDKRAKTYWAMSLDKWFAFNVALGKSGKRLLARQGREAPDETPFTFTPTGKSKDVAGHAVHEFTARGGSKTGSVWLAGDLEPSAAVKRYDELAAAGGMEPQPSPLALTIPGQQGLALEGRFRYESRTIHWETIREVVEVSSGSPPPDLIAIPVGFARVPPPTVPRD